MSEGSVWCINTNAAIKNLLWSFYLSSAPLSDVKGGKSMGGLLFPHVLKKIQAHLKIGLCPAAVANGAVSAESVALSA